MKNNNTMVWRKKKHKKLLQNSFNFSKKLLQNSFNFPNFQKIFAAV